MNASLLFCLCAFGAALVFALVVNGWRERIVQEGRSTRSSADHDLPSVSLLVPVRNGAETITGLLQDLYAQHYPKEKLEVLVLDDHSEDGTVALVQGFMRTWPQLGLIRVQGEGKKAGITEGLQVAKSELIILTDADARCGPERLETAASRWQQAKSDLLLMPVFTESDGSLLGAIQREEQAGLLAVGAGSALGGVPVLANGANMAFSRSAFVEVGGYEGDPFASGDDLFLLDRMRRAGKKIDYLLDRRALVTVFAEPAFQRFWQQRLRWAGKMRGVPGAGKWAGMVALLLPYFLVFVTCSLNAEQSANQGLFRSALLLGSAWFMWFVPVIGLVREMKRFLGEPHSNMGALFSLLAFMVYAPVIAVVALFVRPVWKGRVIR